MNPDGIDASLLINILQFLVTVYQVTRNNDTVVRVLQEVSLKIKKDSPQDSFAFVSAQLEKGLNSEQAASVSKDITFLGALFTFRADADVFNYFGVLAQVFDGVVAFCDRSQIFRLRGGKGPRGRALQLERTASAIFIEHSQRQLVSQAAVNTSSDLRSELALVDIKPTPRSQYDISETLILPLIGGITLRRGSARILPGQTNFRQATPAPSALCVVKKTTGW
jgi:hypothetical protein